MFEVASRRKFRFPYKGMVQVEDLWDLSVRELDQIFKTLNARAKQSSEESLLDTKTREDEDLTIMIDIVKHIVNVKVVEEAARTLAVTKREQKKHIMEIMASKHDEDLRSKSLEDLQALLKDLDD